MIFTVRFQNNTITADLWFSINIQSSHNNLPISGAIWSEGNMLARVFILCKLQCRRRFTCPDTSSYAKYDAEDDVSVKICSCKIVTKMIRISIHRSFKKAHTPKITRDQIFISYLQFFVVKHELLNSPCICMCTTKFCYAFSDSCPYCWWCFFGKLRKGCYHFGKPSGNNSVKKKYYYTETSSEFVKPDQKTIHFADLFSEVFFYLGMS